MSGVEGSSCWLDFADFLKKYAVVVGCSPQRHNHCLEHRIVGLSLNEPEHQIVYFLLL